MIVALCIVANILIWLCFNTGSNQYPNQGPPPNPPHGQNIISRDQIMKMINSNDVSNKATMMSFIDKSTIKIKNNDHDDDDDDVIHTNDFIIHINDARSFSREFSGSGFRFGMATPEICPISSVGYNINSILGAKGSFYVNSTNPYGISSNTVSTAIENAFSTWINNETCNFTSSTGWYNSGYYANSSEALTMNSKNEILFFDLNNPSILAVTILWVRNGTIVEGDIVFNTYIGNNIISDLRSPGAASGFNFYDIMLHEVGHLLGVGHSPNHPLCEPSIMFPSLPSNVRKEKLSAADKDGIKKIFQSYGVCRHSSGSIKISHSLLLWYLCMGVIILFLKI